MTEKVFLKLTLLNRHQFNPKPYQDIEVYEGTFLLRIVRSEGETTFLEKVKTLEKLADLGAEDRLIDQALSKLLRYAEEKAQKDLEGIAAKLRCLEEQFSMDSELFYEKFHKGELGDEEEFFRWEAIIEMQRRITQRLAVLHG